MRNFTLIMGIFNIEVEEHDRGKNGIKRYNAKSKDIEFSVENNSGVFPIIYLFWHTIIKKRLECSRDPSKVVYKGITLELKRISYQAWKGSCCKELVFEDEDYLNELIDTFLDKVDEHLEKTMKTQFSIVYEGYTLEVWQKIEKVTNTPLWNGKCEAINFKEDFHYLDKLVTFFQKAVDEWLKPTKIEYKGYELEIVKRDSYAFVGTSNHQEGWKTVACTKEVVEERFKKEVDEKDVLSSIKNLERLVSLHQEELEEYLKSKGYMFDSIHIHYPKLSLLYAIYPDYWDRWAQGDRDFPEGKVVFIRQQ